MRSTTGFHSGVIGFVNTSTTPNSLVALSTEALIAPAVAMINRSDSRRGASESDVCVSRQVEIHQHNKESEALYHLKVLFPRPWAFPLRCAEELEAERVSNRVPADQLMEITGALLFRSALTRKCCVILRSTRSSNEREEICSYTSLDNARYL